MMYNVQMNTRQFKICICSASGGRLTFRVTRLPAASTMLVPEIVTGGGGWKTTLGTVKLKAGGVGGVGGKGGGGDGTGGGGGLVTLRRPSKISPIFVVFTVSSTGFSAPALPALIVHIDGEGYQCTVPCMK